MVAIGLCWTCVRDVCHLNGVLIVQMVVGFFMCNCDRVCFFFFSSRRRHTRFKCDWSSDVCSSDLFPSFLFSSASDPWCASAICLDSASPIPDTSGLVVKNGTNRLAVLAIPGPSSAKIGRASCRERV